MNVWPHRDEVLIRHCVLPAQWAVLSTALYYIPLPWQSFVCHVKWLFEIELGLSIEEVAWGLRNCIDRGWVAMTLDQAVIQHLNIFGQHTGYTTVYPREGIVLTPSGHETVRTIAIDLFGSDYFANERMPQ